MTKTEPPPRKFFARSPSSAMWLGKDGSGAWKPSQDFGKAWAFDSKQAASEAWDEASVECLRRCAKSSEPAPAWAASKPVFLEGRTPQSAPAGFEYYLGFVDGRFVCERPSGYALVVDERDAKVFGSAEEALLAVVSINPAKSRSAAVLPIRCEPLAPRQVEGRSLDALAQAICSTALREEMDQAVPQAGIKHGSEGSEEGRKRL